MSASRSISARPTAVTMGDPAGVGGEILLKAWLRHRADLAPFFAIDDPGRLVALARRFGLSVPIERIGTPADAAGVFARALPVLDEPLAVAVEPGRLDPANGGAVLRSIERAVAMAMDGTAGAVVTNPIHKFGLSRSGFKHPGHTEFLAALAGVHTEPVMMLAADMLRVVAITRHVSVRRALELLDIDLIVETARITDLALRRDFAVPSPRLAFAGLNPHAGESGLMGTEEIEIIAPAIERLRADGLNVSGPHPSDTMFNPEARTRYDAALCMYHDQALIPIKTIAFDSAVNVTLGLPFIRTSPDHGTALDIAARGAADESSLVSALRMAGRMAANRAAWNETNNRSGSSDKSYALGG